MNSQTATLYPPLAESKLTAFELEHGISLPAEYRAFLLNNGNGGEAFFKLGEMDHGWDFSPWKEGDGFVGVLSRPFPYTESWNDLTGHVEYDPDRPEEEERRYEHMEEAFEKRYYQALDGALPLAHLGCATRLWLVVSGAERGNVWCDDRANHGGLRPVLNGEGNRVGFLAWYHSEVK